MRRDNMKKSISIILTTACIVGLVGCGAKNNVNTKPSENISIEEKQNSNNSKNQKEENQENETSKNKFEEYSKLIGLTKEELINTLEEDPVSIDEGGLEFPNANIRVWFENYGEGPTNQIFIQNKEINFNGAKIGDKLSNFKKIFGEPILEDSSSAYSNFKYNDIILSVYYDSKTEETFSVYILNSSES